MSVDNNIYAQYTKVGVAGLYIAVYDCACSVSGKMQTFLVLLSIVGTFALVFGQPKPCGKLYSMNRISVCIRHTM